MRLCGVVPRNDRIFESVVLLVAAPMAADSAHRSNGTVKWMPSFVKYLPGGDPFCAYFGTSEFRWLMCMDADRIGLPQHKFKTLYQREAAAYHAESDYFGGHAGHYEEEPLDDDLQYSDSKCNHRNTKDLETRRSKKRGSILTAFDV